MRTHVSTRSPSPRPGDPPGFALLSVLIGASVIMAFVAAFGRHVIVEGRWSQASAFLLESQEACQAGLSAARQCLVSGQGVSSGSLPAGDGTVELELQASADLSQQFQLQALGPDGLGVRRVVQVAYQPAAASAPAGVAQLPSLNPDALSALLANDAVDQHDVYGYERLEGVDLTGVLVLHPGAVLELDDVVLHGAVVSAAALVDSPLDPFDPTTAPALVLDGNVHITATSALADLAVLMPDGVVTSSAADGRLQLHGDVVAHTVELAHPGALDGNVTSVMPPQLDQALDLLGRDRRPASWSEDLDLGGVVEPVSLAFVPQVWSLESLAPIITYWES